MAASDAEVPSSRASELRSRACALLRAVAGPNEGKLGLAIVVLFLFVVLLGPTLAPYSPYAIGVGLPNTGPSSRHWLGTDDLGRDILSRLLNGSRSVVLIPLAATLLAFAVAYGKIRQWISDSTPKTRPPFILLSAPTRRPRMCSVSAAS